MTYPVQEYLCNHHQQDNCPCKRSNYSRLTQGDRVARNKARLWNLKAADKPIPQVAIVGLQSNK